MPWKIGVKGGACAIAVGDAPVGAPAGDKEATSLAEFIVTEGASAGVALVATAGCASLAYFGGSAQLRSGLVSVTAWQGLGNLGDDQFGRQAGVGRSSAGSHQPGGGGCGDVRNCLNCSIGTKGNLGCAAKAAISM